MMGTYGRVSRYGLIAFASSLDRIGPFATNSVRIWRHDGGDGRARYVGFRFILRRSPERLRSDTRRSRLAESESGFRGNILGREWIRRCARKIEGGHRHSGATRVKLVDLHMPHTEFAIAAYYIIATAEASSNLARYDGVRFGLRGQGSTLAAMYRRRGAQDLARK